MKLSCNEKDQTALLMFKQGVVNNSNKLSSWSSEEDCCTWKGVQCDNVTRRVTRLDLNQEYLEGEINLSLLQIEFLTYLDLSLNGFTGLSFPNTLNKSLLTPSNTYANFSNLKYLDLSFNEDLHLDNLQWLSQLSSLKWLNLSLINLENETNWLQTMAMHPSLLELRLASCYLNNISPSVMFVNFSSLVTLDLSGNYFDSELPYWLFNISSEISYIDLNFNTLQGQIPKSLLNLQNLKYLGLVNNELTGPIPDWLGKHEHLQHLGLTDNLFSGSFPSSLGNLSSLTKLTVSSTLLSYLDLSDNLLTGVIPDCWENWRGLAFLFLDSNKLGGEIPPSMGLLNELIEMNLHNNNLSGEFSLDMSNFTSLVFINLGGNNFSGAVPMKMPESMQVMILKSNKFTGKIPPQLCSLPSILQLDLSRNKLSGSIPPCVYNITSNDGARTGHFQFTLDLFWKGREMVYHDTGILRNLDVSSNNLSGEIPPELFGLTQLLFLNLSRNNFMGKIPSKIGGMKNLESLDLSNNHLSGEIPAAISNLSFLSYLNLSYNDFTGQIPLGTQLQSFDAWSYAGNPKLCGLPLTKNCSKEENDHKAKQGGPNGSENDSLYLGMGVGFVVGLWGVWGSLFHRAWRHKYFRILDHILDSIYVFVTLKLNKFREVRSSSR
uniref:Serine/threonine-protein kinase BRI1-like 2 n=1 Tax=Cajanus cajan TaxID=3821 RepID=A0A151R967_CAJCA|nr:Serine/threonine-protein kinase BRI1-like 2 [Cajanus cajan]